MNKYLVSILAILIGSILIFIYFKKNENLDINTLKNTNTSQNTQTAPKLNSQEKYLESNVSTSTEPDTTYISLECFNFPNYFVVTANKNNDDVGSYILIRTKTTADQIFPCSYIVNKNDTQFAGSGSAEYFITILDHYLLTDTGTSPGLRGLNVYDLNTSKSVFDDLYMNPTSSTTLSYTYWTSANIPANTENCTDYNKFTEEYGGSAKLITEVTLDLSTMKKNGSGKIKCVYQQ